MAAASVPIVNSFRKSQRTPDVIGQELIIPAAGAAIAAILRFIFLYLSAGILLFLHKYKDARIWLQWLKGRARKSVTYA
jgi:hypothetical protein